MGFREARINAGLSVREVMAAMGVSDAAVYQWETGVTIPRGKMLKKLSELYACTVDELLADSSGPECRIGCPARSHSAGSSSAEAKQITASPTATTSYHGTDF